MAIHLEIRFKMNSRLPLSLVFNIEVIQDSYG